MTSSERLYRAELARCWRNYRTSRYLPITHEYAAKDVRRVIDDIRAWASRRGASRPPSWAQ